MPWSVAAFTSINTTNRTYATRYVSKNVILTLRDLARLSLLVRCKAIQYDFQNSRVQIDMAFRLLKHYPVIRPAVHEAFAGHW